MVRRIRSSAVGQAAISSSVRPQPEQMPRFTLQMLRQGDGTRLACSSGMAALFAVFPLSCKGGKQAQASVEKSDDVRFKAEAVGAVGGWP